MTERFVAFDGTEWDLLEATEYEAPSNTWQCTVSARCSGPAPRVVTTTVGIPGWPLSVERMAAFVKAILAATKELLGSGEAKADCENAQ